MTYSSSCLQQRQKETEKTKKLVTFGIFSSIAFHGVLLIIVANQPNPITKEEVKPIELILVQKETPETNSSQQSEPSPTLTTPSNPTPVNSVQNIPTPVNPVQPTPTMVEATPPQNPIDQQSETLPPPPQISQPQQNSIAVNPELTPENNPTNTQSIQPLENNNSTNPLRNSINSSSRVMSNEANSNQRPTFFDNEQQISSGRITNNSSRTPNSLNNQSGDRDNLRNSLTQNNRPTSNGSGSPTVTAPNNADIENQATSLRPQAPQAPAPESIRCVSNCQPSYPSALQGVEGQATVRVNLDGNGNVSGASIVNGHNNAQLNREALLAAQRMRFSAPSSNNASVQVRINFTVAGSEFDRLARQKREEQEREAQLIEQREREARQAQLEQERQQQLERERQQREAEAQAERERQQHEAEAQAERERQQRETEAQAERERQQQSTESNPIE